MTNIIFQNFKNKRKSIYLLKKQKDLCSLQRLTFEYPKEHLTGYDTYVKRRHMVFT